MQQGVAYSFELWSVVLRERVCECDQGIGQSQLEGFDGLQDVPGIGEVNHAGMAHCQSQGSQLNLQAGSVLLLPSRLPLLLLGGPLARPRPPAAAGRRRLILRHLLPRGRRLALRPRLAVGWRLLLLLLLLLRLLLQHSGAVGQKAQKW